MHAPHLRPVMDAEQYQHERQRLRDLYGTDADSVEQAIAKRDQALAELFCRSGWTQEQLAEAEGKSQSWVVCRLRLGRFLAYATNITTVILDTMTERNFRSYWEQTEKTSKDNETARFDAVIRLMQGGPAEPATKTRQESIERAKAFAAYDAIKASGQPLTQPAVRRAAKVGHTAVRAVFTIREQEQQAEAERQKAVAEAKVQAPIDTSILSASQQVKFEALEKRLRANLETWFNDRVQAEVTRRIEESLMPYYAEKLAAAELLMKRGKPFTHAEYRDILASLHPDCIDAERRNRAFRLFKEKEVLLRPEEKDRPLSSDLPKTLAELLARRKTGKGK